MEFVLFIGFHVQNELDEVLKKIDPAFLSMFIQENTNYLQKVNFNKKIFLGKKIGKITDIASLNLLQTHIFSILKKIVPDYSFENRSLVLFPLLQPC